MDPVLAAIAAFATVAFGTGTAALVRVFVVDRRKVNQSELNDLRAYAGKLRADLNDEIEGRRHDRAYYEERLIAIQTAWDACRRECLRLRGLVEGLP